MIPRPNLRSILSTLFNYWIIYGKCHNGNDLVHLALQTPLLEVGQSNSPDHGFEQRSYAYVNISYELQFYLIFVSQDRIMYFQSISKVNKTVIISSICFFSHDNKHCRDVFSSVSPIKLQTLEEEPSPFIHRLIL